MLKIPASKESTTWICSSRDPDLRRFRAAVYTKLRNEGWDGVASFLVKAGLNILDIIDYAIEGATWEDIQALTDKTYLNLSGKKIF